LRREHDDANAPGGACIGEREPAAVFDPALFDRSARVAPADTP
jgi:hypothetical protein